MSEIERDRLPQLDFLRAVAVALVIGRHTYYLRGRAGWLSPADTVLGGYGWIGVDLFFVLSGFLVTGLLYREFLARGELRLGRFLVRRALKIWPAYFVFLAVVIGLRSYRAGSIALVIDELQPNLLHLQNYFPRDDTRGPLTTVHTWSLALEEHFYLVVPAVIAFVVRRSRRWPLWLGLTFLVAAIAMPVARALFWNAGFQYDDYFESHLRGDGLVWGCLLALGWHTGRARLDRLGKVSMMLLVAGVCAAAWGASMPLNVSRSAAAAKYFLIGLGLTGVLNGFLRLPASLFAGRILRTIAAVGRFSYSIYLFHFLIGGPFARWFVSSGWLDGSVTTRWTVTMAVSLVASAVTGALAARLIEFPVLAMRDRLYPVDGSPRRDRRSASRECLPAG